MKCWPPVVRLTSQEWNNRFRKNSDALRFSCHLNFCPRLPLSWWPTLWLVTRTLSAGDTKALTAPRERPANASRASFTHQCGQADDLACSLQSCHEDPVERAGHAANSKYACHCDKAPMLHLNAGDSPLQDECNSVGWVPWVLKAGHFQGKQFQSYYSHMYQKRSLALSPLSVVSCFWGPHLEFKGPPTVGVILSHFPYGYSFGYMNVLPSDQISTMEISFRAIWPNFLSSLIFRN